MKPGGPGLLLIKKANTKRESYAQKKGRAITHLQVDKGKIKTNENEECKSE